MGRHGERVKGEVNTLTAAETIAIIAPEERDRGGGEGGWREGGEVKGGGINVAFQLN